MGSPRSNWDGDGPRVLLKRHNRGRIDYSGYNFILFKNEDVTEVGRKKVSTSV